MVHTYSADEDWWSKGHGTLIDDADGNWYIVYHAYRNGYHTLGRSTIIESVVWTEDGWPVLANQNGAEWNNKGLNSNFDYLKDFSNPIMWTKWEPGFEGGTLWNTTAIDESYEITAEFESNGAAAGLYLFYNEKAFTGTQLNDSHFYIRILNDKNVVSVWKSTDGNKWDVVIKDLDVSSYHHNIYQGFFALRPSIMVNDGVTVKNFKYVTK
jgi:beta-xylosidase